MCAGSWGAPVRRRWPAGPVGVIPTVGRPYTFHHGTNAASRLPSRPTVSQLLATFHDCGSRASASCIFKWLGTIPAVCDRKDSIQKGMMCSRSFGPRYPSTPSMTMQMVSGGVCGFIGSALPATRHHKQFWGRHGRGG